MLSPGLLEHLSNNPEANFSQLIVDPSRAVLFYCGININDIKEAHLASRFPQFDDWIEANSEDPNGPPGFITKILTVITSLLESSSDTSSSTVKRDSSSSHSSSHSTGSSNETGLEARVDGVQVQVQQTEKENQESKAPTFMQELNKKLSVGLGEKGPPVVKTKPKVAEKDRSSRVRTQSERREDRRKDVITTGGKEDPGGVKVEEDPGEVKVEEDASGVKVEEKGERKDVGMRNGKKKRSKSRSIKLHLAPSIVKSEVRYFEF